MGLLSVSLIWTRQRAKPLPDKVHNLLAVGTAIDDGQVPVYGYRPPSDGT
jgi:hypothetical protein